MLREFAFSTGSRVCTTCIKGETGQRETTRSIALYMELEVEELGFFVQFFDLKVFVVVKGMPEIILILQTKPELRACTERPG